jgi:small-conductance mechanosensitive channel
MSQLAAVARARSRSGHATIPRILPMLALLVALGVSAGPDSVGAQAPGATPAAPKAPVAPPAATPAPTSIPVPEIATRAEDVARQLRDLEALLMSNPAIEAIERRLPELTAQIATQTEAAGRLLDGQPAGPTLDVLTAQWQAIRAELVGHISVLAGRATAIERAREKLAAERETWTRARADARASRVPAPVIERIDGVLAALANATTRLHAQRAATLVLQERIAQEVDRCEVVLGRVAAARQHVAGQLLERNGVPLWAPERASALVDLPAQLRQAVGADAEHLRQFVRGQRWKIPVQLALLLGFTLLMLAARRRAPAWAAASEGTAASLRVFARPFSAALVLTVLATGWIHLPAPSRAVVSVGQIVVLVPALRLARLVVDPTKVRGLYVLGGLFLADLVRHSVSVVPLLEQQIFLIEMLAAIAAVAWWLARRRRAAREGALSRTDAALRLAARVALVVFAVAFVAGAAGYINLGLLLGAGVLGNGYLALVAFAGLRVADGLAAFALRVQPLSLLGMVRRHGPLLERRAHGVFRALAIAGWAVFALRYFGLWWTAVEVTRTVLGAELRRGALSISLGDVLVFVITAGAAFLLSGVIRFVLEEDVYPRLQLGRGLGRALSSVVHYGLLLVGFLLALAALGVDLTKVTILAGAFGVGIGFGLQTVVNNFVSGLIVLFERRIGVGDAVQIGDVAGEVQHMGMRACTVRTWEGAEVIVPNASLVADKVTNWTLSDRRRRIDVGLGVAYGTPPEKVLEILLAVARAHPHVLADPEPVALFLGAGAGALRFEVRAWTARFELWVQTQSELSVALYAALGQAGIEIPLPQHEVRLRRD